MNIIALIPAYNPSESLINIVHALIQKQCFLHIVCVNDGSNNEVASVFDVLKNNIEFQGKVTVLEHITNLGKGFALKTGLNHIGLNFPNAIGVVTLDADGQHLPQDCYCVAKKMEEKPDSLILGVRSFKQNNIPLRSKIGNILTSKILKFFTSIELEDTQTGLRGIPMHFFKDLMKLKSNGYEFELDMLILSKNKKIPISQVDIETIYIDDNHSSHFNPLLDSLKIYMVFFRFVSSSLISFFVDTLIFLISISLGANIAASIFTARLFSGTINFILNKNFVFKSDRKLLISTLLYISTVIVMGFISYALILTLTQFGAINIVIAKIMSELFLYSLSFILQREFIFTSSKNNN